MHLILKRYSTNNESTLGLLFINGKFECYTIEDTYREEKVMGETRIPAGIYQIKLRNEGGMTKRYAKKFPGLHKGMLWLQRVKDFKWVYIHIGNKSEHSEGCILVGNKSNNNQHERGFVGDSASAYKRLYEKVSNAIGNEYTYIEIIDMD